MRESDEKDPLLCPLTSDLMMLPRANQRRSLLTNINETDAFGILEKVEYDGDVLQFLRAKVRPFVVARDFLLRENFDQGDEIQAVAELQLEIVDVSIDELQMFVRPSCEGVLLNAFPRCVVGQFALHVFGEL